MGDAADPRDGRRTFIVPAIKPFDHYDFSRAKIACNLAWLVAKAFGTENVPEELREPFYTDQYDQEHIKPPVVGLLLSAELYCRAGSLILRSDAAKPLLGHDAVIQALAQKGLYVTDQEKLVTERDLHKKPIQMSAHLAMIDTLMMAYTVEMVSVEKVAACAQQYSAFFQATDLPYDIEDAVMYWINKVNEHLKDIMEQEQKLKDHHAVETLGGQKSPSKWFWKLVPARYRKEQTLLKQLPCIPLVENLLKDGSDGCALAALIHFYCPGVVRLEDICLKETMSLADSLYNLQLIQEFCQEYLNQCCHFTLEDMLYAAASIKSNYLVFMAELFWWFEVVKPSFVQPRVAHPQGAESVEDPPSVPVLNAAQQDALDSSDLTPGEEGAAFTYSGPHLPSRHLQPQPHPSASGGIRRSSSMSYVDGFIGTWPKEKRSSVHGVSFDISFDKENPVQRSTSNRGITRSLSNDGLALSNHRTARNARKNLAFKPVDGEEHGVGIAEEHTVGSHSDLTTYAPRSAGELNSNEKTHYRFPNGALHNSVLLDELGNQVGTPSIEEALQIIHDTEKPAHTPRPDQLANGFFLHSQELSFLNAGVPRSQSSPENVGDTRGALSPVTDTTEVDTGIHVPSEDIPETMDEDSSLRDYTVSLDSDMDDASKFLQDYDVRTGSAREALSPCPSTVSTKSQPGSSASSSSGVKMTSFAEQKFRKLNHTDGKSSGSSSQKTTPEGSELNIPHVVAWAPAPEDGGLPHGRDTTQLLASEVVHLRMKLEEKRRAIEAQKKKMEAAFTRQRQKMGRTAFLTVVKKKGDGVSPLREEAAGAEDEKVYTERPREKEPQKANGPRSKSPADPKEGSESPAGRWPPAPSAPGDPEGRWSPAGPAEEPPQDGELLEHTRSIERLNASLHALQREMRRLALQQEALMHMREQQAWVISPPPPSPHRPARDTPRPAHPSPQAAPRKSASFSVKNQRTPRPSELKITPLHRTLTPPRSVDSLPRLRRFSPSQVPIQTRSFVCLGDDGEPRPQESGRKDGAKEEEGSAGPPEHGEARPAPSATPEGPAAPASEVAHPAPSEDPPSQPVQLPSKPSVPPAAPKSANLIEVSLSDLKPPEKADVSVEKYDGESDKEQADEDQKVCCGFFFKDDQKAENDMAMKRAALLEKRLRREKETQLRKQQLEAEMEHKKEETRRRTEEERQKKEDERARREFIRQEYLRRKQLKLMEDMDTVLKPRPQVARQKKQRPKSIHRDHLESPKTPVKGPPVSSLSLASLNMGDSESLHSGKRTPRSESVEGFLPPSRCGSRNGEKDWENASTASSVASGTEYTGPKLFKEPSAKSNKHIIQNALAHCCLAGKVNEGQKKKILEEMEKSDANNFLILFRDSGCQFRSLYAYCPDTEEISKLTGIGPKSVTKKMIEGLYKYNSDRKQFSHIPAKTLSASVDAITIHSHLWQAKRPVTPKKLLPTKA
ncbi:calmodulin-regulated spectrin-associated protein 2 isoform X1 [Oryx dammah]|uniref:calmodulin-regulated spectrin-associated protein 2 isoform X1 n=1 Tax=Oryx dammah TaxID=59534 RepID=UPI001A9BDFD6|nr:calmodulin-regulated spectrin-associated protein 2 isoform X1 [Oryx dammah]XP_040119163.1 calmodulin-regulated spectrin-associated protein 2 isoform X1 [Oryx dammah]XP_040119164.1 calmodulin-regulated spectrin-associated protein 2 isoform X1 [Oryx dammah]